MKRAARGFTLVELIFACGILSIVAVMVTNLLPSSAMLLRSSQHRQQATRLAHRYLEEARAMLFADLRSAPRQTFQDGIFQVERTVAADPGADPNHYVEVRVHVDWSEFGRPRSLEMKTGVSSLAH